MPARWETFSLALLDPIFFFYIGTGKKGLVNSLYQFCSADPQFLGVVDWPLITAKRRRIGENDVEVKLTEMIHLRRLCGPCTEDLVPHLMLRWKSTT